MNERERERERDSTTHSIPLHPRLRKEGRLAAYHFCRHDDKANGKPVVITRTICRMLCDTVDGFKEKLGKSEGIADAMATDKLGEAFEVRAGWVEKWSDGSGERCVKRRGLGGNEALSTLRHRPRHLSPYTSGPGSP